MGKSIREYNRNYAREHRKKHPEVYQGYELKKKYGITLGQYKEKLAEQGGCCAVCRAPTGTVGTGNKGKGTLAVDHCHTSGVIRGLLCTKCNLGIGSFRERPGLLRIAALYLERHEARVQQVAMEESQKHAEAAAVANASISESMEES